MKSMIVKLIGGLKNEKTTDEVNKILKRIRNQIEYLARDFVPRFRVRGMTSFIYNNNGNKELVGAEIGVDLGRNAKTMLSILPINKLYLIDPYSYYDEYKNIYNTQDDYNKCETKARELLKSFNNKIEFIKSFSEDAKDSIPDNLDFVYIDGNHNYSFVKKDIELYWSKVKDGGVLGGHDFNANHFDVVRAVLEFTDKNNLELMGQSNDWWVIK